MVICSARLKHYSLDDNIQYRVLLQKYEKLRSTMEKINNDVWPRHYSQQQSGLLAFEGYCCSWNVRWLRIRVRSSG